MSVPAELYESAGFRAAEDTVDAHDTQRFFHRRSEESPPGMNAHAMHEREDEDDASFAFGKPSALLAQVLDDVDVAGDFDSASDKSDEYEFADVGAEHPVHQASPFRARNPVFFDNSSVPVSKPKPAPKKQQDGEAALEEAADNAAAQNESEDGEAEFVEEENLYIPQLQKWMMVTEDDEEINSSAAAFSGRASKSKSVSVAAAMGGGAGGSVSATDGANMFFLFGQSASRMRSSSAAATAAASPKPAASTATTNVPATTTTMMSASHSGRGFAAASGRFRGVQQRKDDMLSLLAELADCCERNSLVHFEQRQRQQVEADARNLSPAAAARRRQEKKRAILQSLREYYRL